MTGAADAIHVLHVDDDPDFVALAAELLVREDDRFEVETATSAGDGLDRLADRAFDCVVSDYDMPGLDGLELLETVREDAPRLPFILFTGQGSEEVASEAIAADVTDYLQKGGDPGVYALLANRVTNAVEQRRSRERAENLDRIRLLLRDVNELLVRARTREDVDAGVCRLVSRAAGYRFVWIGDHDDEAHTVVPRASAGEGAAYLDELAVTTDDAATAAGPTGRAVRRRELATTQSIPSDPDYEPWREAALAAGFRSSAAVPLVRDGVLYGVLNVYSGQECAFDGPERDLLVELGEDVAHAIHRVETEQVRRRFEQAVEQSGHAVYITGPDGTIDYVNPAFERITGYPAAEAVGRTPRLLRSGEMDDAYYDELWATIRAGEVWEEEVVNRRRSGERYTANQTIAPIARDGAVTGYVAIQADVTRHQARARELARMHDRIEFALAHTASHVWVIDEEAGRTEVYGPTESLYGVDPERVKDADFYYDRLVHPEDRDRVERAFAGVMDRERDHFDLEFRVRYGQEAVRWLHAEAHLREEGEATRLVGVTTDVTARKEREIELQRYRQLVDWMDEGAVIVDPDGRYVLVDERAAGQHAPEEWLGRPVSAFAELASVDEATAADHEAAIRRILAGECEQAFHTMTVAPPDGAELVVETRFTAARDADGELLGVVGIARDITERAARERQLRRERDRLDRFAGVVSHDLRNPLAVARGRLDLARGDGEHLDAVDRALQRMETLIAEVLALARAGETVGEPAPVALADLVAACWGTVETASARLVAETSAEVRADRQRLRQLLENLLRNAVDHGGEAVTVTVGDLPDGFYVEDDGPGVPAADRARVFEPGYTTAADGTGLGLAICREVALAHGWSIRVTAGAAGGARFELTGIDGV